MKAIDRKRQAQSIISIFETGHALGSPSTVALLTDGAGISYGIHQATDRSGALDAVVHRYMDLVGGDPELASYLPWLAANETSKDDPRNPRTRTRALMDLLERLGCTPMMERAQHEVFDELYWRPAVVQHRKMGLRTALALAIVYDTCIHSGPAGVGRIRRRFPEVPPAQGGSEQAWCRAYVAHRRQWLLTRSNPIVHRTVYRMDAFDALIAEGNWDLETPFVVRGQVIR